MQGGIFNKDAEPQYRDGDIIKITKVYGWKKRDSESAANSLDTKPTSEVEMSIPAYFAVSKDFLIFLNFRHHERIHCPD